MKRFLVIMGVLLLVVAMLVAFASTAVLAFTSVTEQGSVGITAPGSSCGPSVPGVPPDEEPVPPIPEYVTPLLLVIGVLAVAGYVVVQRIRRHSDSRA